MISWHPVLREARDWLQKAAVTHLSGVNLVAVGRKSKPHETELSWKAPPRADRLFAPSGEPCFTISPPPPARLGQSINTRRQPTTVIIETAFGGRAQVFYLGTRYYRYYIGGRGNHHLGTESKISLGALFVYRVQWEEMFLICLYNN